MNTINNVFNRALLTGLVIGVASLSTGCASIAEHQRHINTMEETAARQEANLALQQKQTEILAAWAMFNSKNNDGTPDIQAAATGLAILIQYSEDPAYAPLVQKTFEQNETNIQDMRERLRETVRQEVWRAESSCTTEVNQYGATVVKCQ